MEMEWERHKSLFASDGSLRDIYVRGTDVADWQRLLDFLRAGAYTLRYIVIGDAKREPQPLPEQIEAIFARPHDAYVALLIDEPQLGLVCHFFCPDEIELDLDPRAIDSEARLDRLRGFMRALGRLLGKEVILTPENMPEHPLFRYDPRTGREDWPTGGRYEL
jgi:hypothetical protein